MARDAAARTWGGGHDENDDDDEDDENDDDDSDNDNDNFLRLSRQSNPGPRGRADERMGDVGGRTRKGIYYRMKILSRSPITRVVTVADWTQLRSVLRRQQV